MNTTYRKAVALLLAITMIWIVCPTDALLHTASALSDISEEQETVCVLAGTDFQPVDDTPSTGVKQVKGILSAIQAAGYAHMDGFLFAGDYEKNRIDSPEEARDGKEALQKAVREEFGLGMDEIYVQGNHDPDSLVEEGTLTQSGENDTESYGVYVIHEKDYPWEYGDRNTVQATANALREYLDGKLAVAYSRPIFVISHLPLHYSMRTLCVGDGKDADLLFDVLNDAGKRGLNIFFLFGHNHAQGWDDYMGGASVYLQAGDKVNIAQNSFREYREETLAFTYMNAGYVGYYSDDNNTGVDAALTMTVFAITDREVRIERYSAEGLHALKSPGAHGANQAGNYEVTAYSPNTLTYASPRIHTLHQPDEISDGDVTVRGFGVTSAVVAREEKEQQAGYRKYVEYTISMEGIPELKGGEAVVQIGDGFDAAGPVQIMNLETGKLESRPVVNGTVSFPIGLSGRYVLFQMVSDKAVIQTVRVPARKVLEPVRELKSGEDYAIVSAPNGYFLTADLADGCLILDGSDTKFNHLWRYEQSAKSGMLRDYLRVPSNGSYLSLTKDGISLQAEPQELTVAVNEEGGWTVKQDWYLHQSDAESKKAGTTQNSDSGNLWLMGKVTEIPAFTLAMTMESGAESIKPGVTFMVDPSVTVDGTPTKEFTYELHSSDTTVVCPEDGRVKTLATGLSVLTVTLTSVNGEAIDTAYRPRLQILITVAERQAVSAYLESDSYTVEYGMDPAEEVFTIFVVYDDGTTERVPVTVAVLEASFDLRRPAVYRNLTISWDGLVASDRLTLTVLVDDQPAYPQAGSVLFSKEVEGIDFAFSGLSQVELSVAGMPAFFNREGETETVPAATNAVLTDTLSRDFVPVLGAYTYVALENGKKVTKTHEAAMTILAYELYTAKDVDGETVTEEVVGSRKSPAMAVETVTFNEEGTEAYSNLLPGNILKNGVICAKNFFYNSNSQSVSVDTDMDGKADKELPHHTLYWYADTLQGTELTLTYSVYFTGAAEGDRKNGEYSVGTDTTLTYVNWAEHDTQLSLENPSVVWVTPTERNGIWGDCFYVNGVREKAPRLICYEGHYYFIGDGDKLVKNTELYLSAEHLSGAVLSDGSPFPEGLYRFDGEGRITNPPETETETVPETEETTSPTEPEGPEETTDPSVSEPYDDSDSKRTRRIVIICVCATVLSDGAVIFAVLYRSGDMYVRVKETASEGDAPPAP